MHIRACLGVSVRSCVCVCGRACVYVCVRACSTIPHTASGGLQKMLEVCTRSLGTNVAGSGGEGEAGTGYCGDLASVPPVRMANQNVGGRVVVLDVNSQRYYLPGCVLNLNQMACGWSDAFLRVAQACSNSQAFSNSSLSLTHD